VAIYSVSLCSGGGGLDIGLDLACPGAFAPVLYVEYEAYAASVLATCMEEGSLHPSPIWSDVHTLTSSECSDYLCEATGGRGVEFVYGGIPCQPHSVAGQQRGEDDPRDLWPSTLRFIEASPSVRIVFIENVPGMLSTGGARRVVEDLERLGFRCALGLFTASEIGAPHKRERLFILAHLADSAGAGLQGPEHRLPGDAGEPGGDLPLFPPGPSDRAAWAGILARWPGLAPAVDYTASPRRDRTGERAEAMHGGGECVPGDGCDELPLFPPGPSDRAAWAGILERWPGLAPAISYPTHDGRERQPGRDDGRVAGEEREEEGREPETGGGASVPADDSDDGQRGEETPQPELRGLAHGIPHRAQRLRLDGNAVVPQCVAAAFISLSAALAGSGNED